MTEHHYSTIPKGFDNIQVCVRKATEAVGLLKIFKTESAVSKIPRKCS